jgi:hypothetical protein
VREQAVAVFRQHLFNLAESGYQLRRQVSGNIGLLSKIIESTIAAVLEIDKASLSVDVQGAGHGTAMISQDAENPWLNDKQIVRAPRRG